ncbi:MAG: proteasome assembly chaperone family protein [Methanomicrobiales archaeon]
MDDIKITSKSPSGEKETVLIGFPGSGLVGSIALQYIAEQLDFNLIGTMTSRYFPPVVLMSNGIVNVPVRFYEKDDMLAIVGDVPVHPMICYEVANGLIDWITRSSIREIVSIAGIITNQQEKRVFGVATTSDALETVKDDTIVLPMGSISGIPGSILTECKIREIPAIGLLGETINAPDPRAAAAAIEVLNSLYDLEVPLDPLLEQAEEIEAAMEKLAEQVQEQGTEQMPKKEHLPMYG